MKAVRDAVSTRRSATTSFELIRESDATPAARRELERDQRGAGARARRSAASRWSSARTSRAVDDDFLIALARDARGEPAGFLRLVPALRRGPRLLARPDAPRARLGERADRVPDRHRPRSSSAASGVARLSLNFAAWGRLLDSAEDAGVLGALRAPRGPRPQPLLPDPVAARLQPEVRPAVAAALDRDRRPRRSCRRSRCSTRASRASSTCRSSAACSCRRCAAPWRPIRTDAQPATARWASSAHSSAAR